MQIVSSKNRAVDSKEQKSKVIFSVIWQIIEIVDIEKILDSTVQVQASITINQSIGLSYYNTGIIIWMFKKPP